MLGFKFSAINSNEVKAVMNLATFKAVGNTNNIQSITYIALKRVNCNFRINLINKYQILLCS